MIAITGATGKLGHHVIQELVKKVSPSSVVALVRDPAKASDLKALGVQLRRANYDDKGSLIDALSGVQKLLLISSSEVGKREQQHKNVIAAAQTAKVQQIAYTSILRADSSTLGLAKEHLATEIEIKKSGLTYTLLRNGWYFENYSENAGSAIATGTLLGAAGKGRFSAASRQDYALAAVKVLTQAGHENKVYELGGSSAFTLDELASQIQEVSKKPVVYKDLVQKEYANLLVSFGLPEGFANLLADSDSSAKKGDLFTESKDLENLIGRKSTGLKEHLQAVLTK